MCAHVCVSVCIILKGVGAEHFLRGNCGNRDITKRPIASFPMGGEVFLAINKNQILATMTTSE